MRPIAVLAALVMLGCATPSGTYREYFGFTNTPPESRSERLEEPSPQRVAPSQTAERRDTRPDAVYVVVPEWYVDWYAPWCVDWVYVCYPGYHRAIWHPWYYRWWRYYAPWYPPRVVVVVPREEPPVRVRDFGPSRGSVDRAGSTTVSGSEGGGRSRGRKASDGRAEPVRERVDSPARENAEGSAAQVRTPESGGGRKRAGVAEDSDGSTEGGGRSRGKP